MTDRGRDWIGLFFPRRLITPCGFLWIAAILAVLYFTCDWLGWREYTSFLSGTGATGEGSEAVLRGGMYVVAYMGLTLGTPVLVLAAGIFAVLLRVTRPRPGQKEGQAGTVWDRSA